MQQGGPEAARAPDIARDQQGALKVKAARGARSCKGPSSSRRTHSSKGPLKHLGAPDAATDPEAKRGS